MENKFESKSTLKLIFSLGIPPIISMLIQSLYAIIDSLYVAKVSEDAFNAVSLVYPLQNIILSIAVGLGVALNGAIARSLGKKNEIRAKEFSAIGVLLTIIHYVLIVILSLIIINPFVLANTTEVTESMARTYISIISFGSIGLLFHLTFEKILQGYGNMIVPTVIQICGCLLNIVLDHIFVLVLNYGVGGAATATIISQCTSASLLFVYVLFNKKYSISFKHLNLNKENLLEVYKVCLPATLMMSLPNVLMMILNSILTSIDSLYVNVLNLYLKVQTFVFMPISGLTQGLRPILGYFYGARRSDKLKEALKYGFIIMLSFMLVGVLLFNTIPHLLIKIYFDNPQIITAGVVAFRVISISFIFVAISFLLITFYESLGYGVVSLIINISRQFVITIVCSLLFVFVFDLGAVGVWSSIVIAEVITAIFGLVMFRYTVNNTNVFNMNT